MSPDAAIGPTYAELAPILDTVLDAVVVIGGDGIVVGWNAVAEQAFGWKAGDAIGRSLADLIIPPQHRQAHDDGMARLLAGEPPRVLRRLIEITAMTATGTEIPVELSITTAQASGEPLFVGFLRDISRKKAGQEKLRRQAGEAQLMFEIARLVAEAESFEGALQDVLAAICRLSGWSVGHAFLVPETDPPRLVSTSIWYEDEPGGSAAIRAATENLQFEPHVGLPGTILANGEPLWISDADRQGNFPRASSGFRGAFGFPLKSSGRIIAILEFFARSPSPPDTDRLLTVRVLGEQIGRLFERRRREDRERLLLHELNHRVKNQLAVIQAIATQTFRKAASYEEGLTAFSGRLRALAVAQDLMLQSNWTEVRLRDLLATAIGGSGNALERFEIDGPDLKVRANHAVPVTLAVHELCTNSVKYGALSVPEGRIVISWRIDDDHSHVDLEWREIGGPVVAQPQRRGFGTTLLMANLERELGGKVSAEYRPEGLVYKVHTTLSAINRQADSEPASAF